MPRSTWPRRGRRDHRRGRRDGGRARRSPAGERAHEDVRHRLPDGRRRATRSSARPVITASMRCRSRRATWWTSTAIARVWQAPPRHYSMNIVTTRGCPFHCNWCAKPIYGQRYTARSPSVVADETPGEAHFAPTTSGSWTTSSASSRAGSRVRRPDRAKRAATPVQVPDARRPAHGRASMRAGAAPGCRTLWIGAESGSQKVLDAMEKGTTRRAGARRAACARRGHPRRLLPPVRLPRRDLGRHRGDAAAGARLRAGRHRHLGVLPAAGDRRSTIGSRQQMAGGATGSTPPIWR